MLRNPELECNWNIVLPVYNSSAERNRVKKINPNLTLASYPLTREYLNNYFASNKFDFSNYSAFIPDCAASMYSFFLMTFGYKQGKGSASSSPLPAQAGGGGMSFGFNPFFGLFDIDNPMLWILLTIGVIVLIKK